VGFEFGVDEGVEVVLAEVGFAVFGEIVLAAKAIARAIPTFVTPRYPARAETSQINNAA
jgi:hypothetical protein